jgi:MFS family permease
MGLRVDLGMSSDEYGVAMLLLFLAYVIAQIPCNLCLAQGRPSVYLSIAMALAGCACAATAFVNTPGQLYAARFVLGLVEAPFCIGCLLLISSWYTRAELATRSAILLSAPLTANAFAGLIAFGIRGSIDGARGLAG